MTEQEFKSKSFKHSQPIDYISPRHKTRFSGILIAINFDAGTFCLWLPSQTVVMGKTEIEYNEQEIWVRYEYVFLPKFKLKAI